MRRSLTLVLGVALAALVFAPAAFAQDDNPSADDLREDDRGGERGFDDNPSRDDLGADDNGGGRAGRGFDDNPTGDDVVASPAASASAASGDDDATANASAEAGDDDAATTVGRLPETGGAPLLSVAAGVLLLGGGVATVMLMRRAS